MPEANQTVDQSAQSRNSIHALSAQESRHGIVTLFGYGIKVRLDRGHLFIEDGIGAERRTLRLPRVGHGLRRLVVIGSDGMISLSALRWLADQDAAFVLLNRDGSVLATTGPVRSSDARLRRLQALAPQNGVDVTIARELISHKLAGQEQVARDKLRDSVAAQAIAEYRLGLAEAQTLDAIRYLESKGAAAYWAAWRGLPVMFPKNELIRVPDHWRRFTSRRSPLSGSPRLAADPVNAILNYLFAVLESESRLAAAALGLDPGFGFLHLDAPARDSLACDLMEPVRPQVEAWVLDWITREPVSRRWFFEQRDGNCRLMAELCVRLSQTAPTWGRAVAPYAEWLSRTLWKTKPRSASQFTPPTRLTQARKREAKGPASEPPDRPAPRPESVCRGCGSSVTAGQKYCRSCWMTVSTERMMEFGHAGRALGRVAAQSEEATKKLKDSRQRHAAALAAWDPSTQPSWLTEEYYRSKIQPELQTVTVPALEKLLGVSKPYASAIRAGRRTPHPRHWLALAGLVGVSLDA